MDQSNQNDATVPNDGAKATPPMPDNSVPVSEPAGQQPPIIAPSEAQEGVVDAPVNPVSVSPESSATDQVSQTGPVTDPAEPSQTETAAPVAEPWSLPEPAAAAEPLTPPVPDTGTPPPDEGNVDVQTPAV